jgi:predicted transcriptional regulator
MTLRRPYDGEGARRAILAVAVPGKLLPRQADIGRLLGLHQSIVSYHLSKLRDEWRIVTRFVVVNRSRRIMVDKVP